MGFSKSGGGGLLEDAGYASGDTVTVASFHNNTSSSRTTSSSTYTTDQGLGLQSVTTDLLPSGTTFRVRIIARMAPGTDEEAFIRLTNLTDTETVTGTETSRTSIGMADSGWTNYTPTTTGSPISIATQVKTTPGSANSSFNRVSGFFGVEL